MIGIGDILQVVDKLVLLLQRREQNEKRLFEEVVKPVFDDLLMVHSNYLELFEHVHTMLPSPDEEEEKDRERKRASAVEYLHRRRVELLPLREHVKLLTEEYQKYTLDPLVDRFTAAAATYLYTPFGPYRNLSMFSRRQVRPSPASMLLDILTGYDFTDNEGLEYGSEEFYPKVDDAAAKKFVRDFIDELNEYWSDLCKAYADIKVNTVLA